MNTLRNNHYFIILSGGLGTRLWPLSRNSQPKQFLKIFDGKSLLQNTIQRLHQITPKEKIFLVTNQKYSKLSKNQLKNLIPHQNILLEPSKKNIALALMYGCTHIYNLDPNAIITALPADHIYPNEKKNLQKIEKSYFSCQKNPKKIYFFTRSSQSQQISQSHLYLVIDKKGNVQQFIKKPSIKKIQKYIKQSVISADTFTFKISNFLNSTIKQLLNKKNIKNIYKQSNSWSLIKFLNQYKKHIKIYTKNFEWIDINEWKNIYDLFPKNKQDIASNSKNFFHYLSRKSLIISNHKNKKYATVGINNLAIIDTPQALLVCNLAHDLSYNVKDLIKLIHAKTKNK